ncbi:hypothetical protein ACFFIS_06160 [Virgibacillus soli]|uniref:hypothetical protein n=1 Tax=Paracerasibacillus soli TaxID=480284 RepID=UPI0035E9B0A8
MQLWHTFKLSLKIPSKRAVFQLNRIGMDIVVFYLFVLLAIVSIPPLIDLLTTTSGFEGKLNIVFKFIYFFIFSYLPLTIIIFLLLSLIAYVGKGIAHLLKRKLIFSLLWKMVAFTTTIPFLLYAIFSSFYRTDTQWLMLFIPYSLFLLVKIILIYPKRKRG